MYTYLTNRKEFHKRVFFEPIALYDQMIAQNGHVRLRTTKRHQSEWPKRDKDCVCLFVRVCVNHCDA